MNIEITVKRGGNIRMTSFDPVFLAKIEAFMEENPSEGEVKNEKSAYRTILRTHRDLVQAVSKVIGTEAAGKPFTVTIKVEGDKKIYPPGTARLYST